MHDTTVAFALICALILIAIESVLLACLVGA